MNQRCAGLPAQGLERRQFVPLPLWRRLWMLEQDWLAHGRQFLLRRLIVRWRYWSASLITGMQKTFCYSRIPFSHQNRCITGSIKAMSPSRLFVDRERALVIASVDVTIGSHIFSQIEWIAQFRLVNDLDPPALSCYYRDHLKIFSAYLALPGSSTLLAASIIKLNLCSILILL